MPRRMCLRQQCLQLGARRFEGLPVLSQSMPHAHMPTCTHGLPVHSEHSNTSRSALLAGAGAAPTCNPARSSWPCRAVCNVRSSRWLSLATRCTRSGTSKGGRSSSKSSLRNGVGSGDGGGGGRVGGWGCSVLTQGAAMCDKHTVTRAQEHSQGRSVRQASSVGRSDEAGRTAWAGQLRQKGKKNMYICICCNQGESAHLASISTSRSTHSCRICCTSRPSPPLSPASAESAAATVRASISCRGWGGRAGRAAPAIQPKTAQTSVGP